MKRIINYFKHLIYRRKELKRLKVCLTVIIDAKNYYVRNTYLGMCNAFSVILFHNYFECIERIGYKNWIHRNIPEFKAKYLTGIEMSHGVFWWNVDDIDNRIKAFDKLIDLYKTKIKELYENKI